VLELLMKRNKSTNSSSSTSIICLSSALIRTADCSISPKKRMRSRCNSHKRENKGNKMRNVKKVVKNDSPELDKKKNFYFSRRNYYPRQNTTMNEKRNMNPFEYYSNNFFPIRVSPKKNYYQAESNQRTPITYQFFKNYQKDEEAKSTQSSYFFKENLQKESNDSQRTNESSTKTTSPILENICLTSNAYTRKNTENVTNEENAKKSHFVERQGDWVCTRCKNLNFSFRIMCNRCKISKTESEMIYEGQMHNIYNLIKYNEMVHSQMLLVQGSPNYYFQSHPMNTANLVNKESLPNLII